MSGTAPDSGLARARLALGIAVLCVSTGAIFVRLAHSPALATAAWRMTFATGLMLLPLLVQRGGWRALSRRELALGLMAGLCLAVHFASWISSLDHTTVASSVVLVNTIPLWVALLSPLVTRERTSRGAWTGIALSFIGAAIIAGGDLQIRGPALWGDFLALLGGLAAALYLLAGRSLRARLSLPQYCALTYGSAALLLWLLALGSGVSATGYPARTWLMLAGMTLVAQIGGHTLYNWSLKHLSTGTVAVALLGEPVGGTLLAWLLFREQPPALSLLGAALVLAGIYLAGRSAAEREDA